MTFKNIHEYLGDAVYIEYDGYAYNLRLNDHRSDVLIVLEPNVILNLGQFIEKCDRIRKDYLEENS